MPPWYLFRGFYHLSLGNSLVQAGRSTYLENVNVFSLGKLFGACRPTETRGRLIIWRTIEVSIEVGSKTSKHTQLRVHFKKAIVESLRLVCAFLSRLFEHRTLLRALFSLISLRLSAPMKRTLATGRDWWSTSL